MWAIAKQKIAEASFIDLVATTVSISVIGFFGWTILHPDMNDRVAKEVGGLAAAVSTCALLFKSYLSQSLAKDLKQFEYGLKELESNRQSEQKRRQFEYQTRFGLLHDRQAKILLAISVKLTDAIDTAVMFSKATEVAHSQQIDEQKDAFRESLMVFHKYFTPRRVFLPESITSSILDAAMPLYGLLQKDDFLRYLAGDKQGGVLPQSEREARRRILDDHIKLADKVIVELRQEFRKLIGIDPNSSNVITKA